MDEEAIVRIRYWENQDDCRDVLYAVPTDRLSEIQALVARDRNSADARALVEHHGRKLEPQVTVEVVEY
ncbi:MAG: hypothetical protein Q7S02_05970 [bacterium]|nr:hypothetical protein [bacterium]